MLRNVYIIYIFIERESHVSIYTCRAMYLCTHVCNIYICTHVCNIGPPQFQEHFRKHDHALPLHDPLTGSRSPLIKRSALGLVAIYNLLPHNFRAVKSVPAFQKSLQEMVTKYAASGHSQWSAVFSPRLLLTSHPLASQYL